MEKAVIQNHYHTETISSLISSHILGNRKAVSALAGLEDLQNAFMQKDPRPSKKTNRVLDRFNESMEASVIYLMNQNGDVTATSNRSAPDSFLGENYRFRPYFSNAVKGVPSIYMAVGKTSKKRGIYYSHPVYHPQALDPIGVVVMKINAQILEKKLIAPQEKNLQSITLIANANHMIFMSNKENFLYNYLWYGDEKKQSVAQKDTEQFGNQTRRWAGFKTTDRTHATDQEGNRYFWVEKPIDYLPGWKIIHLSKIQVLLNSIASPFFKSLGYILPITFLLIGMGVYFLYALGRKDVILREESQKALIESEKKFRAIFEQAALGVSLTSTQSGSLLQVNQKYCDIVGYSEDALKNKTFQEITHPEDLKNDLDMMEQLKKGKIKEFSIEKRYIRQNGSIVWANLTVSSVWHIDEKPTHHLAVIEDITERKMMETKVKTLSGLIPICSKCKKIRDDKGYWNNLEAYIQEHSDAEFSHSLCVECSDKLYGNEDWYMELKKKGN